MSRTRYLSILREVFCFFFEICLAKTSGRFTWFRSVIFGTFGTFGTLTPVLLHLLMDVEEVETLLKKSDHTEEEYAKIHSQCGFTYASTAGFSVAFERSDLIDLRVPPGSVDAEPSLSALIYAAQGILHPTLSFNHVPDFLDVLSQIERAREFLREHAKWALIWQRFYETRPNPNIRVLQKSDKDILKKLLNPERLDAMRRIFICIVEQIIRMVRSLVSHTTSLFLPAIARAFFVDAR